MSGAHGPNLAVAPGPLAAYASKTLSNGGTVNLDLTPAGHALYDLVEQIVPSVDKDDFLLEVEAPLLLEVPTGSSLPAGFEPNKKAAEVGDGLNTVQIDAALLSKQPRAKNLKGARVYLLEGAEGEAGCSVGRHECTVTLTEDGVSRKHATFLSGGGNYFLVDLDSANGSFVNRKRVKPGVRIPLEDRCSVWLGSFRGVFLSPDMFYDLLAKLAEGSKGASS